MKMITGNVTLTPSIERTIVKCEGCTKNSLIFLQEQSEGATSAMAYVDPEDIVDGEFTIWHNAVSQATFSFVCMEGEK